MNGFFMTDSSIGKKSAGFSNESTQLSRYLFEDMIVKVRLTIYFNEKSKSSFFLWNRTPIAKPSPWIKIVFELLRQSMKPRDCVDKENVQISALNGYVTATSSSIIESGKSTR